MKNNLLFEEWPGGLTTFTDPERDVNLIRPWQSDSTLPGGTYCPYCPNNELEIRRFEMPRRIWRVIENRRGDREISLLFVPHFLHCVEPYLLQMPEIAEAFDVASLYIEDGDDHWFVVQFGGLAGASIFHPHCHLVKPHGGRVIHSALDKLIVYRDSASECRIADFGRCSIYAGGIRAGQCFILPQGKLLTIDIDDGFEALEWLVAEFNRKFKTAQALKELPPEYQILCSLTGQKMRYITYTPILAQFGAAQYQALIEGRPIALHWPHQKTAAKLR